MLRRLSPLILMLSALLCLSAPAFAWDEVGHKITAYIAWQRMTPDVRERVIKILLSAPEDSQIGAFYASNGSRTLDTRKREFFMVMATWPDIIRDTKYEVRNKKYANSPWHYADTFWEWKDGKVVFIDNQEPSGLAMQKLVDFDKVIRGTASDAEKAIAITWLEHLVGDIHQPLHSSGKVTDTSPKGDQGGNLFLLTPKGTPRDKQENLHWFWDSIVIRYMPNAKDQCDADYIDPIAQDIIKLYPYDKIRDKVNDDKFDVWAKESLEVATTEVYKDLNWFEMPSDKYKKRAFEIAQQRLGMAGYRMGDLFNEVFGTTPAIGAANSGSCKVIRKVMYPVTQTSSVKQSLEIALLDLCSTQPAARPMYTFMIDGKPVMKEYGVVKVFKTEAEARKFAAENNITDFAF